MKKIKLYILSLGIIFGFGLAALPLVPVYASSPLSAACQDNPTSTLCKNQGGDVGAVIGTIVDTLLFGIGVVSVVMIIYAGIRYSISMGDAANITKAKNTLMYAVVGLVIAFLASPATHWLIDRLSQ